MSGARRLGPFETSSEALLAVRRPDGSFNGPKELAVLLRDTLAAAGVATGEWDIHILLWLAGLDAQTVAAVAGWVSRANLSGGGSG